MIEWITKYLDENNVDYVRIPHELAYTTEDIAELAHTPAMQIAKTVIYYSDGQYGMAVVPGGRMVDMDRLRRVTGGKDVRIAHEHEFAHRFPQCELGAMPPFGHLYGMRVLVDRELAEHEDIVFNGGSHTELIRMPYRDFRRLVHPMVVDLCEQELV
jgi:Ala-tRNA(Pro) deacylase